MRKIWLVAAFSLLSLSGLATAHAQAPASPTIAPDDRVLGKADAQITIFEYFSLTCPHCAEFSADTFPKVKADWIDTGKAKLVYRDYPLDKDALQAAVLARCAPPERYPAFVEVLFKQQEDWGRMADPTAGLKRIALLGGISEQKFSECMADKSLQDSILASRFTAQNDYGVDSTPTFFVNGKKIVGALPYDQFAKALAQASAAALPAPSHRGLAAQPFRPNS
jgi:protein-disulfide isomerase